MLHVTAPIPKFQCHAPTPVCNNGWARPYEESQDMNVFIQIQRVAKPSPCEASLVIIVVMATGPFARPAIEFHPVRNTLGPTLFVSL